MEPSISLTCWDHRRQLGFRQMDARNRQRFDWPVGWVLTRRRWRFCGLFTAYHLHSDEVRVDDKAPHKSLNKRLLVCHRDVAVGCCCCGCIAIISRPYTNRWLLRNWRALSGRFVSGQLDGACVTVTSDVHWHRVAVDELDGGRRGRKRQSGIGAIVGIVVVNGR